MGLELIDLGYLFGALLFVLGLRNLSSPDTARKGNLMAAAGMGIAILLTLFYPLETDNGNYLWVGIGMIIGGMLGYYWAKTVKLTDMPQLVSMFNGFGGACAVLLGFIELIYFYGDGQPADSGEFIVILFTLLVGSVSFTGSLLAWAKLDGRVDDRKVTLPKHSFINIGLMVILLAFSIFLIIQGQDGNLVLGIIFTILALVYGFSFVAPIGGADMPVVISLLNSFTGLTAAAAGLIYDNRIMLIGGILVGSSGTILTILMCQAMNRSLLNVIVGGFGSAGVAIKGDDGGVVKEVTANDAAIRLYYSQSVIFVPGYGLAVAQAQKVVKELDDLLEANGVDVKYAIHPVAGRMPGHMNVLLAEADVPYPKLIDLEEANSALKDTNIVVIIGANDVVNPAALDDPASPIYGMPVLEVWNADNVIVMKRSMSPGYAGIQNPLFFKDNTNMLFGDAKASVQKILTEVKTL